VIVKTVPTRMKPAIKLATVMTARKKMYT